MERKLTQEKVTPPKTTAAKTTTAKPATSKPATEKLLEVKGLTIELKKNRQALVKDISFALAKGRTLGLIGESGSGKTLTSKAILRLLNPGLFALQGEIRYAGRDLLAMPETGYRPLRGKELCMIMQNPMTAFAPMTRIGRQITAILAAHLPIGPKEAYARAPQALQDINLTQPEKIMGSYPHELSGGMLQRVMIALSLLLKPRLIADEATTAVDAVSEEMILGEFAKIKAQGISLLVITHDFGVAGTLADDILVMKDGQIVEGGTVQEIFRRPRHSYTQELMAAGLLTQGGGNAQSG
ncbi:ABC transporter ATP-binding protein [Desulfitobacterium chlororespirans]|uniref:Nickel transport system ATP-binding protein n=1 Tax=Desulfitobacterium chlororespirans DSM 11544 TaxID=1121395 RepID=A0A1M7TIE5_9FIRM|nr:ABC transporter ATP-binding protein [Desulfitobacterium chlororespirans]SHN70534.1 nickel transport system ATP-binding protein [Desulfitobacterium chlororespirans DSM 11544]